LNDGLPFFENGDEQRRGSAPRIARGSGVAAVSDREKDAVLALPREVPMAVDPDLLSILVCPKSHGELTPVDLPEAVRARLIEKYREHFRDEAPSVEQGLWCAASGLVYPIVSDIPILLVDEALPASEIGR